MKLNQSDIDDVANLIISMGDGVDVREKIDTLRARVAALMPRLPADHRNQFVATVERRILVGHYIKAVTHWREVAESYHSGVWIETIILAITRLVAIVIVACGIVGGILYLVRSCG